MDWCSHPPRAGDEISSPIMGKNKDREGLLIGMYGEPRFLSCSRLHDRTARRRPDVLCAGRLGLFFCSDRGLHYLFQLQIPLPPPSRPVQSAYLSPLDRVGLDRLSVGAGPPDLSLGRARVLA